jgi:hypothetical protein
VLTKQHLHDRGKIQSFITRAPRPGQQAGPKIMLAKSAHSNVQWHFMRLIYRRTRFAFSE